MITVSNALTRSEIVLAADQQAAEDAMWAWYLEWAGIARISIRDRRLLRALGFLKSRKNGAEADDHVDVLDPHTEGNGNTLQLPPPAAVPALTAGASVASRSPSPATEDVVAVVTGSKAA